MVLPLLVALCIGSAHAESPSGPDVTDAVRLLSRYAPGELPATPPVLTALAQLGESGTRDVVPLLRSLAAEENGGVAHMAQTALDDVTDRVRASRRDAYRAALPHRDALAAWLEAEAARAVGPDGEPLSKRESQAVAYAAIILGETSQSGPQHLELVEPEVARARVAEGVAHEREGAWLQAVSCYAQASASGFTDADARLEGLGVDVERLLLGMTADTARGAAVVLPPTAVEALLPRHGRETVAVLLDRAERGLPLTRAVALDVLAQLNEQSLMTPRESAAARRTMAKAAEDPRPYVREVAASALNRMSAP